MKFSITVTMMTVVFGSLVGCSDNTSVSTQTSSQIETLPAQGTPNKPSNSTKYTVITTGTADPFSIKDENGVMSGIDVEIIRAIAETEGFNVDFFESPWQKVLPAIESKEYDIAINGINYSEERSGKYSLTTPYFYNPSAFMYKKDLIKHPKLPSDLSGLSVGVMKDAKPDIELSPIEGVKVDRFPNLFTAYKALVQGRIEVVAYDMAVMQSLLKKHGDTTMTIVPYENKSNKATYNIFVVHKDNQELLQKLNSGLDKLQKSGKIDEIRKKYVGE